MTNRTAVALISALALGLSSCRNASAHDDAVQGIVEYEQRVVAFEVPGQVLDVRIHRGEAVESGTLLVALDDTLAKLTRDARASELEMAKASLALLKAGSRKEDIAASSARLTSAKTTEALRAKILERTQKLAQSGALPESELDRAQAAYDSAREARVSASMQTAALWKGARPQEITGAEARLEAATASLAHASEQLRRHKVHSLIAGKVLDVHVKAGEFAMTGRPVATIADVTRPFVDVFIPQGKIEGISIGADASVRVDGVRDPLSAKVEWISPKTEFTPKFLFSERERPNLVIRVRLRIDDSTEQLHSGVPAFAHIRR